MIFLPAFVPTSPITEPLTDVVAPPCGSTLGKIVAASHRILTRKLVSRPEFDVPTSTLSRVIVFAHLEQALRLDRLKDRCKHGMQWGCCVACIRVDPPPPIAVVDYLALPPTQQTKKLSQHQIDGWLRIVNRERAFSEYGHYDPFTEIPSPSAVARKKDTGYHPCAFPADEPNYLRRVEPKATPYDPAWDVLRKKALEAKFAGHLNFCPRCWVARVQRVPIPKERACKDCKGLAQLDATDVKVAKTLEDYCAKWQAKYDRKRLEKLRASQSYVYSSDGFDREILVSRGSVMGEAVRQFDKDPSRKGNKYRIQ